MKVEIELLPLGAVIQVEQGTPLQDVLFAHGVEFPCGGRGRCKGCKIKVLAGAMPIVEAERQRLTEPELAAGWRLACCGRAESNLRLELAQWEATILADETVFAFTPQSGLGVAIDLGTTTVVAQLVDLNTGRILAVRMALNEQARHGADIMSRVEFAVSESGQAELAQIIRRQLGGLIEDMLASARSADGATAQAPLKLVAVVGNTVMHHLFCGVNVEPLSHYPFEPEAAGLQQFSARNLGWQLADDPQVYFLPCLGGFVGSDILAGVLATRLHESEALVALMDLGTNGEIVVGNRDRMLCASTAAGPAFEGARISMGMRAATGAISEVKVVEGRMQCHVLGQGPPRGICGSGLVDAVAAALDLGLVRPNGRLATGDTLPLLPPVELNQWDVRELQLAKGAIAAGLQLLLDNWGASLADLQCIHLAGAFGNYINHASARRIGLLNFPSDKIRPAGNTALLGAKLALFDLPQRHGEYPDILSRIRHLSLHADPNFQESYVTEMTFPAAKGP